MITKGRERENIDPYKIIDRARQTIGGDDGYANIGEFIHSKIEALKNTDRYTKRMWDNQPQYVEVWVEKDALATLFSCC
jgi:hypothetical protein